MSTNKSDIVKAEDKEVSKEFLDQFKDDGASLDTLDDKYKQQLPLLMLCQGGSTAVKQGNAKPGEFWDLASEKALNVPITVTPLLIWNNRIRWSDDISIAVPLCRSQNGREGQGDPGGDCFACSERKVWQNGQMVGTCDEQVSAIFYIWDSGTVSMLNFARTKIKVARRIIKLLNVPPALKLFCYAFKLNTQLEQSGNNPEFYNVTLDNFSNNDKYVILTDKKYTSRLQEFAKLHTYYKQQLSQIDVAQQREEITNSEEEQAEDTPQF